ncbi:hypothetical protein BH10PLA2_BH10PLA2_12770 [soil metagenome]
MPVSIQPKWLQVSPVLLLALVLTGVGARYAFGEWPSSTADDTPYKSPYSVQFTEPRDSLVGDLEHSERGNPEIESSIPFRDWYRGREKLSSWGPPARHYPPPRELERRSVTWKRERVIATALRFEGYSYQHHHIPDWQPPAEGRARDNAGTHGKKGVDCSNFSAFAYNLGLGIKPNSDVHKQSEERIFAGPGEGRETRVERIELPKNYQDLVKTLKTGDLLFVKGSPRGHVTHVVLWVGTIGQSPDGLPLVLDSHGQGVKDSNDVHIPNGIHLRPFRQKSWYFESASHATRVIHD